MTNTLENRVYREVQKAMHKHRNTWAEHFFGNFKGNLPGGHYRTNFPKDFKNWDKTNSKLIRTQTISQFHETIDRVIAELGFSQQEFLEFQKKSLQDPETDDFYIEKCIPVYIKLRELGYKHYPDLTV